MVRDDWVIGGGRNAAAADRIYAAATDLVARDGLDALDIDVLARRLHCSRATIYRYAGGKAQIRDSVMLRVASQIVDNVRSAVNGLSGPERVTTAISLALEQIRSAPTRRLMLVSSVADLTGLHSSPILKQLASELAGIVDDDNAAQWVVRVVISMAHWPVSSSIAEQDTLRRFVLPAFERSGLKPPD